MIYKFPNHHFRKYRNLAPKFKYDNSFRPSFVYLSFHFFYFFIFLFFFSKTYLIVVFNDEHFLRKFVSLMFFCLLSVWSIGAMMAGRRSYNDGWLFRFSPEIMFSYAVHYKILIYTEICTYRHAYEMIVCVSNVYDVWKPTVIVDTHRLLFRLFIRNISSFSMETKPMFRLYISMYTAGC